VEHEQILEIAERLFGAMPSVNRRETPPARYTGGERRMPRRLEQANLVLGLPGLSFKDPGYYGTHLFAHLLGGGLTSRLWHEVRETRGLAYSIDAFHWPFSDSGLFGIGAGTAGSDLEQLVEVTLECAVQATRDIDATEVARAKAQMKVGLLAALESPGGRIERVARQLLAWGRVIPSEEVITRVDAVTVDEIREAGRTVLQGAPTLAAIGPIKALPRLDRIAAGLKL
jgi:predicted Zn-dependent peptidase